MKKRVMHPLSLAIQELIESHKGYDLNRLLDDLGINRVKPEDTINYLKESTICERLDVSRGKFNSLKKEGAFKQFYINGDPNNIRYRESDVLALMKENKTVSSNRKEPSR